MSLLQQFHKTYCSRLDIPTTSAACSRYGSAKQPTNLPAISRGPSGTGKQPNWTRFWWFVQTAKG